MKLLVFSDSHNRSARMLDVLAREKDVAACFFLGDGERDVEDVRAVLPQLPLYTVQGNCDMASCEPAQGLAPFGGVMFFYTHGHAYGVKQDLERLWWTASQSGADAALFGHTHMPWYELRDGIHLFNPGSISLPRVGPPSYGRITVLQGVPSFDICKVK